MTRIVWDSDIIHGSLENNDRPKFSFIRPECSYKGCRLTRATSATTIVSTTVYTGTRRYLKTFSIDDGQWIQNVSH